MCWAPTTTRAPSQVCGVWGLWYTAYEACGNSSAFRACANATLGSAETGCLQSSMCGLPGGSVEGGWRCAVALCCAEFVWFVAKVLTLAVVVCTVWCALHFVDQPPFLGPSPCRHGPVHPQASHRHLLNRPLGGCLCCSLHHPAPHLRRCGIACTKGHPPQFSQD